MGNGSVKANVEARRRRGLKNDPMKEKSWASLTEKSQ
jgi:hypothetical protein